MTRFLTTLLTRSSTRLPAIANGASALSREVSGITSPETVALAAQLSPLAQRSFSTKAHVDSSLGFAERISRIDTSRFTKETITAMEKEIPGSKHAILYSIAPAFELHGLAVKHVQEMFSIDDPESFKEFMSERALQILEGFQQSQQPGFAERLSSLATVIPSLTEDSIERLEQFAPGVRDILSSDGNIPHLLYEHIHQSIDEKFHLQSARRYGNLVSDMTFTIIESGGVKAEEYINSTLDKYRETRDVSWTSQVAEKRVIEEPLAANHFTR